MHSFRERGGLWVLGQGLAFLVVAGALRWGAADDVPAGLRWTGVVIAALGLALSADGAYRIRRHITALPAPVSGAPLVEAGAYQMARHPIYGGLVVAALGLATARGAPASVGAAVLLGIFFLLKSRHEEVMLEAAYPGYRDYRSRVRRRLIPWIV